MVTVAYCICFTYLLACLSRTLEIYAGTYLLLISNDRQHTAVEYFCKCKAHMNEKSLVKCLPYNISHVIFGVERIARSSKPYYVCHGNARQSIFYGMKRTNRIIYVLPVFYRPARSFLALIQNL